MAGAIDEYQYTEEKLKLEHGDMLVLYTDGVTEATDVEYREYGEERMKTLLRQHPQAGCQEVIDLVKADVKAFAGEAEQSDDITLLTLMRK